MNEQIAAKFDRKFYSPCELIKALNELFDRELPTQMAYNYIKKGYIAATLNSTNKKQVAQAECVRFATLYFERNVEKHAEVK
jgi:hypothetical protein